MYSKYFKKCRYIPNKKIYKKRYFWHIPRSKFNFRLRRHKSNIVRHSVCTVLSRGAKQTKKKNLYLYLHQKQAMQKIMETNICLLRMSMGSGKTLVAFCVALWIKRRCVYFCPTSCVEQVRREVKKFHLSPQLFHVYSYKQKVVVQKDDFVVLDECPMNSKLLKDKIKHAAKILLMTGNFKSPDIGLEYNTIHVDGKKYLPTVDNQTVLIDASTNDDYHKHLAPIRVLAATGTNVQEEFNQLRKWLASTEAKFKCVKGFLNVNRYPIVFFSAFSEVLEQYRDVFGGVLITSNDKPKDRFGMLNRPSSVFWLQSSVMGIGINLSFAKTLVFLEAPINKSIYYQVKGRVTRISQEFPMVVIRTLIMKSTIEAAIHSSNCCTI